MEIKRILAPMIIKMEEASETIAIETKSFTESISEVRLVNNFEGLAS